MIVIIGENRSFDHVFATYKPKNGETVWNLLSKGIIKSDGTPGPQLLIVGTVLGGGQRHILHQPRRKDCVHQCSTGSRWRSDDPVPPEHPLWQKKSNLAHWRMAYYKFLTTGGYRAFGLYCGRHPYSQRSGSERRRIPSSHRSSPPTITRTAPCIVSIKCGSRLIATHRWRRKPIRAAA